MWIFTRLAQFDRALHSSHLNWRPSDAAAGLQFPQGLLLALLLVTPFWAIVGLALHVLTK